MPRLIDADTIFNGELLMVSDVAYDAVHAIIERINNAPTVDAVEVVRCKECNMFERNNTKKGEVLYCYYHEMNIKEDDFCAWGERREDERD